MRSASAPSPITTVIPDEGEAWGPLLKRLLKTEGDVLFVIAERDAELNDPDIRRQGIKAAKEMGKRLKIASKNPLFGKEAKTEHIAIVDSTREMRTLLQGHASFGEVLRAFSPQQWKQQLKSQLQRMGLLSVPKLRVYLLAGISVLLFFFVILRLLPSAEILVWARQEPVSQTVNVYLVQTGTTLPQAHRVRTMPLIPIHVTITRTITSDHISKEFIGSTAETDLTIINTTDDTYPLKEGTRFSNEAGMVFRIKKSVVVEPKSQLTTRAKADDIDMYGQVVGDRGNVPANLLWKIPGLPKEEQTKIYAKNKLAAKGGTTAYRTVLKPDDIELAQRKLEETLTGEARARVEDERARLSRQGSNDIVILSPARYPKLVLSTFSGITLPTHLLDKPVTSISASGSISYTVFAYDAGAIFEFLQQELRSHVREGKYLVDESLGLNNLVAHVIDYSDDLSYIKLTVDLAGTEQYILDPLTPQGSLFAKRLREKVAGLPEEEALRIIRNMPEIENVQLSRWPPWSGALPRIPSHISIIPQ